MRTGWGIHPMPTVCGGFGIGVMSAVRGTDWEQAGIADGCVSLVCVSLANVRDTFSIWYETALV